MLYQLSYQVII